MIEFRNVSKRFNNKCILDNVSLSFPSTGLVVIQGESGSGKSTILNMIASIEPLDSGSIINDGSTTYILSTYDFINELSVLENIVLKPTSKLPKRIQRLIRHLGIETLLERKVSQCSDGQRQRIGIARALANEQPIILCDEPSEFLDRDNRQLVINLLQYYARNHLVIIASHNPDIIALGNAYLYKLENGILSVIHEGNNEGQNNQRYKLRINTNWVIYKVINKSRWLINSIMVLTIIGLYIMFGLYHDHLLNPTTQKALILDQCFYYKLNETNDFYMPNEAMLPSLNDVDIHGETIRILPLPLDSIDDGSTIVINQNCASYGMNVDDTIWLNYTIYNEPKFLEYQIDSVLEEADIVGCQIYYDLDQVKSDLRADKYIDYNNEEVSALTIMATTPGLKLYQAPVEYDELSTIYQDGHTKDVEVFQPLFTQRYTFDQNAQVYRFIFWFSQFIFLVFVGFALVTLIYREFKSILKALSIIIVFGAKTTSVKFGYLKIKLIDILIVLTLGGLALFGFHQIGITLNQQLASLFLIATLLLAVVVIITDIVCCLRLRQQSISSYFKN